MTTSIFHSRGRTSRAFVTVAALTGGWLSSACGASEEERAGSSAADPDTLSTSEEDAGETAETTDAPDDSGTPASSPDGESDLTPEADLVGSGSEPADEIDEPEVEEEVAVDPPELPPPELICVEDPQTLAEAGACVGVFIGTAIGSQVTAPENLEIFLREFNAVVLENEMKFFAVQPEPGIWSFNAANTLLQQATQRPLLVKGHTLIWHDQLAPWVPESLPTEEDIDALMQAHIDAVAGHYAGTAYAWEVVNEAIGDDGNPRPSVYSAPTGGVPSYDFIARAFVMANAAAPNAQLFYNDYNLTPAGVKSEAAFAMISQLVADGVPIDGVGIQLHADLAITGAGQYYDPARLRSNMQRYAELGLTVNLSEFDVRVAAGSVVDPVEEAQVYYDYVRVCVEEPNCDTLTFWGISDANSWIPGAFPADPILLYDASYQARPAYFGALAALRGDPRPS